MQILITVSERFYKHIIQLYPRAYRKEYGEEMAYVFSALLQEAYEKEGKKGILLLWARTSSDIAESLMKQHRQTKLGQQTMRNLLGWAIGIGILLLVPLIFTLRTASGNDSGWNWSRSDFIFAFVVLFGAALIYELVAKKMHNKLYKAAVGLWVMTSLALIWINGAVGIIGDSAWPNVLYLSVLGVGGFGALLARLRPFGMTRTLYAMAITQMIIPLIALVFAPEQIAKAPGVGGVFLLNACFAGAFVIAGRLFQKAVLIKVKK